MGLLSTIRLAWRRLTARPARPSLAYLFYRSGPVNLQIVMPPKTSPTVGLWTVIVEVRGGSPMTLTSTGAPLLFPVKPGDSGTITVSQLSPDGGTGKPSKPVPFSVPLELPPPQSAPPEFSYEP